MHSVNVDINDYNYAEIKELLDLNADDNAITINKLFMLVIAKIDNIDSSDRFNASEKTELSIFFKTIFYKFCHINNWKPSHKIMTYFDGVKINNQSSPAPAPAPVTNSSTRQLQNNVNPITPKTVTQVISIDSFYRDNYNNSSSTDFTVTLPVSYTNVVQMKLSSAEIPNTYYIFDEELGNNKFRISIYEHDILILTFPVIIPSGSWYTDDIKEFISTYIDNYDNDYVKHIFFSIDCNTGKGYFRWKTENELKGIQQTTCPSTIDVATLTYTLDTFDEKCTLYEATALYIFGFSSMVVGKKIGYDKSYIYGNYIYHGYLRAERIYGFTMNTYMYLSVDDFVSNKKDQIIGIKKDSYIGDNILARIQINNPLFSIIVNNNEDNVFKKRDYFGDVKIRKLHVRILDKFGRVMNLNNSEVSLSIELTQRYNSCQQSTFNDLLQP